MGVPGMDGHVVTIDRLSPDLLGSTRQQVGGFFPDAFVEGVMLFKRSGIYYVLYGSCCCACREGAGVVVHTATNISGPWLRQARDVNCIANTSVCAGMPAPPSLNRPTGDLIINAQGIGLSVIPTAHNNSVYLWSGSRWLSGPRNPTKCTTLCQPATGVCEQPEGYIKGHDFEYMIPLEFDTKGQIQQFEPFVDSFEIDLLDSKATDGASAEYV